MKEIMNRILLIIICFSINVLAAWAQESTFRVVCYNVENYFDCVDDPRTNDSEYLPGGLRAWNFSKYAHKQASISKVLVNMGGWRAPALVGLCEIESDKCLWDLTHSAGLKNWKYSYLHVESPDARGVDVALLYQPNQFTPHASKAISIRFPFRPKSKTRDILHVRGITASQVVLDLFVCHFPSRLGGELESEEKRLYVASVLRKQTDSIFSLNPRANILIMGDFNDYPTNKSLNVTLGAVDPSEKIEAGKLYNLMMPIHQAGKGSHKHNGEWGALDQFIVSGHLLLNENFSCREARVYDADFLLENDEKYLGKQPFRTYAGMKYQAGFADHLPIYVDFEISK
jgi:predicted extracellular nuclease